MKKTRTFFAVALMAVMALACTQQANAQFRFGVKAGVNLNKIHISDMPQTFSADNGCGFTGGVMTEFTVPVVGLCLDASLMYTRMNGDLKTDTGDNDVVKNFFQIPINLKYKFTLPVVSSFCSPYLFTGPDFAFRLGGNNDVFKTKTCQVAWNVGVGFEVIKHLQLSGSYGFGINKAVDVLTTDSSINLDDIKPKNNYWTITAAWLF